MGEKMQIDFDAGRAAAQRLLAAVASDNYAVKVLGCYQAMLTAVHSARGESVASAFAAEVEPIILAVLQMELPKGDN